MQTINICEGPVNASRFILFIFVKWQKQTGLILHIRNGISCIFLLESSCHKVRSEKRHCGYGIEWHSLSLDIL